MLDCTLSMISPSGITSTTMTALAVDGPLLLTDSEYRYCSPTYAGLTPAVLVIVRSAEG